MEYIEAAAAVSDHLGAGDDELAPAGAVHLGLTAWQHLVGEDRIWDRVGTVLLEVQGRLYLDQAVTIEAQPPRDDPQTRAAVAGLLTALARHHQERATAGAGELHLRLDHDAAAQQLRAAAAVLA
ncbi:hypothetical protein [Actinoplanes subglobosus]|uniref:Uncharacterized protein n=1 Tax=Actinoplanes subglobosus TaxID=1547892 RepID=A0ABV8IV23_9ACTN